MKRSVWIGYDPREHAAFDVAVMSLKRWWGMNTPEAGPLYVHGIHLNMLRRIGWYERPISYKGGRLYDPISGAHMSTEFAITRFMTPHLATTLTAPGQRAGWALFMDCDMLVRADVAALFEQLEAHPEWAMACVKHQHRPKQGEKMDGQIQSQYKCKNWSSFMAFNCGHPKNEALTLEMINELPGRDLHRFCWLQNLDTDVGALEERWNWLVGHSSRMIEPSVVHYTEGGPWFEKYQDVPYADEWCKMLERVVLNRERVELPVAA